MKKIFLILITILLLIGIIVCIFVMQPKEVSSIPEDTGVKLGELNDTNILTNNVESSNSATTKNIEIENSINENKEKGNNTNALMNTTSKNKTEDKNKTTAQVQTSNTNKSSNTTSKKTTANNNSNTSKNQVSSNSNKTSGSINKANTNISNSKPTATTKKEETHKHFMKVNAGWFKSVDELEKEVDREFEKWDRKYNAGKITWDELGKYCPIGYESFRCSCGMYGLNYSYE